MGISLNAVKKKVRDLNKFCYCDKVTKVNFEKFIFVNTTTINQLPANGMP